MNIKNLNKEELEQLQTLLNKMNPSQPTEKVYLDPINKMIDDIMTEFDFDKVHQVMNCLDWKWASSGHTAPPISELKKVARTLLLSAAKLRLDEYKDEYWEQGIISGTGGFTATAFCDETKTEITILKLEFVVEEWHSNKD